MTAVGTIGDGKKIHTPPLSSSFKVFTFISCKRLHAVAMLGVVGWCIEVNQRFGREAPPIGANMCVHPIDAHALLGVR